MLRREWTVRTELSVREAATRLARVESVIESIKTVLIDEHVTRFLAPFTSMSTCARELRDRPHQALEEIARTYGGMLGGYGTFADLVLWREEFAERKAVNDHFDELRITLSHLLLSS